LEGNGYVADQFISSLTIAVVMLFPISYILLPLYTALIGGDFLAKEAEDGTLRNDSGAADFEDAIAFHQVGCRRYFFYAARGVTGIFWTYIFFAVFQWGGLFVFVPGEIFGVFDGSAGLKHTSSLI